MYISRLLIEGQQDPVEIEKQKNILIIGPNSIGKTTYLNTLFTRECLCSIQDVDLKLMLDKLCIEQHRQPLSSIDLQNLGVNGKTSNQPNNISNYRDFNEYLYNYFQKDIYVGRHFYQWIRSTYSESDLADPTDPNLMLWYRRGGNEEMWNSSISIGRKIEINLVGKVPYFPEIKIHDHNGQKVILNFSQKFSDGEKVKAVLLSLLPRFSKRDDSSCSSKIYLWDEIETHLHPESQKEILNILSQDKNQFIITSHSPFILKQALLMEDKWIVLSMDRSKEKGIELKKINEIEDQKRKELLNTYGIRKNFIFVEGNIDKDYFNVYFKNDPLYCVISMSGGDNLMDKGPRAAIVNFIEKLTLEEDVRVAMVLDRDKNTPSNQTKLKKGNNKFKCFWISDDLNKKDIEDVILASLEEEVMKKVRQKELNKDKKRELCNFLIEEHPKEIEKCLKSIFKKIEKYFNSYNSK